MMKSNYHTHTKRCGHASGRDEAYVAAAVEQGFDVLGFSDHVPWPYKSSYRHPGVRMDVTEMDEYLSSVRALRDRYQGRIEILTGFECEYFPAYMEWLREIKKEKKLDYLILGNHYDTSDETGMYFGSVSTPGELRRYVDMTIAGLRTGLFTYLAHPDLFMRRWPGFDADAEAAARDLCACCLELGIPMEYNVHDRYLYPSTHRISYPDESFFEIVREAGVPVLIGLDAHDPNEIRNPEQWNRAERELQHFGELFLRELPRLTKGK